MTGIFLQWFISRNNQEYILHVKLLINIPLTPVKSGINKSQSACCKNFALHMQDVVNEATKHLQRQKSYTLLINKRHEIAYDVGTKALFEYN